MEWSKQQSTAIDFQIIQPQRRWGQDNQLKIDKETLGLKIIIVIASDPTYQILRVLTFSKIKISRSLSHFQFSQMESSKIKQSAPWKFCPHTPAKVQMLNICPVKYILYLMVVMSKSIISRNILSYFRKFLPRYWQSGLISVNGTVCYRKWWAGHQRNLLSSRNNY